MNYTAPFTDYTHLDTEPFSHRWSFPTSDARSEPFPDPSTRTKILPPSPPPSRPPPPISPVEISLGVWRKDDYIMYSCRWPPVQEYLDRVRKHKRMLPAPSDIVLALAALAVVQNATDIAHWIFWSPATYWTIGELVDSIVQQQPPLIYTHVPWYGARDYKSTVNSYQLKFAHVVVQRRWYPTDGTVVEAPKRNLRSTADQPERTVWDYFGLVENEGPSRRRSRKVAPKKRTTTATPPSPPAKRATRRPPPIVQPFTSPSSDSIVLVDEEPVSTPVLPSRPTRKISLIPTRSSTRTRRKLTPAARSPRIITAPIENSPAEETPLLSSSSSSSPSSSPPLAPVALPTPPTHSRNRSESALSSASVDTLVVRSPSVVSVETAVASPSSPKKRKADELEPVHDLCLEVGVVDALAKNSTAAELERNNDNVGAKRMVTRNRGAQGKTRVVANPTAAQESSQSATAGSQPSSRMTTPATTASEPCAKPTRGRAKRARV